MEMGWWGPIVIFFYLLIFLKKEKDMVGPTSHFVSFIPFTPKKNKKGNPYHHTHSMYSSIYIFLIFDVAISNWLIMPRAWHRMQAPPIHATRDFLTISLLKMTILPLTFFLYNISTCPMHGKWKKNLNLHALTI